MKIKSLLRYFLILLFILISVLIVQEIIESSNRPQYTAVIAVNYFEERFNEKTNESKWIANSSALILINLQEFSFFKIPMQNSNVSHKGLVLNVDNDNENEVISIGADYAVMVLYDFENEKINQEIIWETPYKRIRDVEFGNIDDDSFNEIVAVTHIDGVISILDYKNNKWNILEIENKFGNETFIHEVEIGDVDNDGINEFVTTPTSPNIQTGKQPGKISVFKWNGNSYKEIIVDTYENSSVKEVVIGDIDNDGKNEIIASKRGLKKNNELIVFLKIIKYDYNENTKSFDKEIIMEIKDLRSRSMFLSDIDNDGFNDLVIGTESLGVIRVYKEETWKKEIIDLDILQVNAVFAKDVDDDGVPEIIASSNKNSEVVLYDYVNEKWHKKVILTLPEHTRIWAIDVGELKI